MARFKINIKILIFATIVSVSMVEGTKREISKCLCSEEGEISILRESITAINEQLKIWANHKDFVIDLKNTWNNGFGKFVNKLMKKHSSESSSFPNSESNDTGQKDNKQNTSMVIAKPLEKNSEPPKSMLNMLAKLEDVENRTVEIEDELRNEQRVRRHLEQEVKEVQSSLEKLESRNAEITEEFRDEQRLRRHLEQEVKESQSSLEMLESRSVEVEGKLRDEQRLRRYFEQEVKESQSSLESRTVVIEEALRIEHELQKHLEKEMNETQSSLISLGDQLQNITISLNAVVNQIQTVVTSNENMNRNIYEDHPLNIAKVDEARELKEGTEHIAVETSDECNASIVSKLSEHIKDLDQKLQHINVSIGEALVPRLKTLDFEPIQKHTGDMLENKLAFVLYKTGQFEREFSDLWTEIRHFRTSDAPVINCSMPVSNDPHLLIDSETDSDGTQRLIFGCRPVGQYALSHPTSHVTCEGGFWKGQYPTCHSLFDANAIEHFSKILEKENPCVSGAEEYQDPTNCSKFFRCSEGKADYIYCPEGLHIIPKNILCVYPVHSGCKEGSNKLINQLRDLIPPISIEPNNLDMPYKGLGTGPAGQLIVYPGSNFTLHCLYPESIWEHPHWNVTYSEPEKVVRSLTPEIKKNNVSLTVIEAKKEDSGFYRCSTPFGKSHGIHVLVKAVICPPVASLGKEYLGFRYRMNADVEYRSVGTTVEFPCVDGFEFAICMGNGKWSRDVPDCELKKRCKDPDTSSSKDLIASVVWPENHATPVTRFSCSRGLRLIGKPSSYCRVNGTWSYSSLPICI